jgi:hypothetical protein
MTNELSAIIEGIVTQIDETLVGVYDQNTEQTNICNTKWARVGKYVKNSNDELYIITEVEPNEYIKADPIAPNGPPLDGIITLPTPYWITGTRTATNREWTIKDNNLLDKTPIVWLLETLRFRQYGRQSTYDFDADLRIFFLDETDPVNYYTADHRENVVYPMQNLANEFINQIAKMRQFKVIDDYELITFSRFGVEQQTGMFQNILDANLSGVELRITLTMYKANCKC